MLNTKIDTDTNIDPIEQALIHATDIQESERNEMLKNYLKLKTEKVNILITGGTGVGKSTTINALFDKSIAKVGISSQPETMHIQQYELGNITIWDSPGLGDTVENDKRHAQGINTLLSKKDPKGNPLIDLVLVILDGSQRDYGTSYALIEDLILPLLGNDAADRVLIAINQADMVMKGRNWDFAKHQPMPQLLNMLENKAQSTRNRILANTGIDITPIYYSAGYYDGTEQMPSYNMAKLYHFILNHIPSEKRLTVNMGSNRDMYKSKNDELEQEIINIKEILNKTIEKEIGERAPKVLDTVLNALVSAGKFLLNKILPFKLF